MAVNLVQGKQIATASWAINALTASYLDGYTSPFPFTGSALITGSLGITGSLNVSEGITGSLFGTASWAENALTASYLNTLNQDLTFNGNLTLNGTASIAFLNVTIESASVIYSSGSNQFGDATSDTQTLIGTVIVSGSQRITGSLNVTQGITGSLFGTSSWATNSISSSYPLAVTGSTLISTYVPGGIGGNTTNSIFIGSGSGQNATNANNSNFLGRSAGRLATSANNSNFLGQFAGTGSTNANSSNFLGQSAGGFATNANNSNFLGIGAGQNATNAYQSNIIGAYAGQNAINAYNSNFIGRGAGQNATSASYSTLLGYFAGAASFAGANSIGSNNIIIGTNITLAPQQKDSINLGAIIFATGSYSDTVTNPYSGSQYGIGRVGINIVNPSYTLEVGGTVAFPNISSTTQTNVLGWNSSTGEVTYQSTVGATVEEINTGTGTNNIQPENLEQSKHATINIYNNLNFI